MFLVRIHRQQHDAMLANEEQEEMGRTKGAGGNGAERVAYCWRENGAHPLGIRQT